MVDGFVCEGTGSRHDANLSLLSGFGFRVSGFGFRSQDLGFTTPISPCCGREQESASKATACLVDVAGHNSHLAFLRLDDARAVGADHARLCRHVERVLDAHHILHFASAVSFSLLSPPHTDPSSYASYLVLVLSPTSRLLLPSRQAVSNVYCFLRDRLCAIHEHPTTRRRVSLAAHAEQKP